MVLSAPNIGLLILKQIIKVARSRIILQLLFYLSIFDSLEFRRQMNHATQVGALFDLFVIGLYLSLFDKRSLLGVK